MIHVGEIELQLSLLARQGDEHRLWIIRSCSLRNVSPPCNLARYGATFALPVKIWNGYRAVGTLRSKHTIHKTHVLPLDIPECDDAKAKAKAAYFIRTDMSRFQRSTMRCVNSISSGSIVKRCAVVVHRVVLGQQEAHQLLGPRKTPCH